MAPFLRLLIFGHTDNKIGDEGTKAIGEGLKANLSLKELDLYGTQTQTDQLLPC